MLERKGEVLAVISYLVLTPSTAASPAEASLRMTEDIAASTQAPKNKEQRNTSVIKTFGDGQSQPVDNPTGRKELSV